jgi:hypothetical protein
MEHHHLQPGLQPGPDRRHYPLDPGEEPDVLCGRHLTMLDQKFAGLITPTAAINAIAKPAATYQLKDQDTVSLLLRAQRNF